VSEAFAPVLLDGKLNVGTQFVAKPKAGRCDTWQTMLLRLGESLNTALNQEGAPWQRWGRENRITSGGRYLLYWCAWLLQNPKQRIPALAFVGPKNSGKSTLGDALELLFDQSGTSDAGELLRKNSQFTGNVALSVLGRIEDLDISGKDRRDRLTPWVTAPKLLCEFKGQTPYAVDNQLHLMMTANSPKYVPIYDDDCRFVLIEVESLQQSDRDNDFMQKLKREAPAFLHLALNTKLPPAFDRLALPPVHTEAKAQLAEDNQSIAERFASETFVKSERAFLSNAEIYDVYVKWCNENQRIALYEDSQSLIRELSEWFANRGLPAAKRQQKRGRLNLSLAV
jgi:phage/plasmid-associated DNA primase